MTKITKMIALFALCGVSLLALNACQSDADATEEFSYEQDGYYEQNSYYENSYPQGDMMNEQDNRLAYDTTEKATSDSSCHQVKNGRIVPSQKPILDPSMGGEPPCGMRGRNVAAANENPYANVEVDMFEQETTFTGKTGENTNPYEPYKASENDILFIEDEDLACDASTTGDDVASKNGKSAKNPRCAGILPVESMNIETPARCEIPKIDEIISAVPLGKNAFKMRRLEDSDTLPRFEVNNYTFKNVPLDLAIQNLVSEAGIKVFSDDALFPEISGDKIRGELSNVLDELTSAGDVYYRYDAQKKQLILSRWGRFVMSVPGGRIGMYTILDALRGANITNVQPDFGTNEIYMRINKEKYNTIKKLTDTIKASPNLVMFDIRLYRLIKKDAECPVDWQSLIKEFGVSRVNSSVNGIVGRILTMEQQPRKYTLLDSLKQYGTLNLISEGVAVMPDGWKVRFDLGQCAKFKTPEQKLSMLFQSNMLSKSRVESNIAIDTADGEITSFHTMYSVGDSLNVIGIPGRVINPAWDNSIEYVIVLTPRLLRLVK